jgi:hypothetical protein
MITVMPDLRFKRLNNGWNAEPNAPAPGVTISGTDVRLRFYLNPFAYDADEEERGCLTFEHCSMWRLGSTNDEGWYAGQCRYGETAPAWGQFYELVGEDNLRMLPTDWHKLTRPNVKDRHFLLYLRDGTFECLAEDWRFERGSACA